ncbi:MAG TPA: hypothetical protein VJ798_03065 [Rhizomicrobium sp.]|nr:hypothetical protein [Rhizomicrobium sp.]
MRAVSVACLALLLMAVPARAQVGLDPLLLSKIMHLLLARSSDYPEAAPKVPAVVMVLAFLGADGAVLDTSVLGSSGNPVLDGRSRELVGSHRWTPLQVDGAAMGSMAILGVVWTPPGMALPTPEEQRQLRDMMVGQPATPPQ